MTPYNRRWPRRRRRVIGQGMLIRIALVATANAQVTTWAARVCEGMERKA